MLQSSDVSSELIPPPSGHTGVYILQAADVVGKRDDETSYDFNMRIMFKSNVNSGEIQNCYKLNVTKTKIKCGTRYWALKMSSDINQKTMNAPKISRKQVISNVCILYVLYMLHTCA